MKDWKVGDFALNRGTLVRLSPHPNPGYFGIEFVSDYERGAGVTCGGHSSAQAKDLRIVSDLQQIVTCRIYAANAAAKAAEHEAAKQREIARVNIAALAAIKDARIAAHAAAQEAETLAKESQGGTA